ncbi:hypothetical protein [Rickettsia montanensis]|uniref:Uncharacterized protein n=1 Tax=Rickettsia montanensis (strain OSU 85-930) TaxID=1105114 RepID=H8KB18_RICMS|nr:hypothetical protein [Rickettsia montanensis]AFC73684.1 hypothetical protein MCI_04200 [Rickettsia montanensis str. OSU 85-930]
MNTKTVEERIAIIEPYLDFFIKDKDLLREIYPNGISRELRIEFILAKKPYTPYSYYKLIRNLFNLPYRKLYL